MINEYAQKALQDIYKEGIPFKKAGVILMGITQDETQQLSMFEYENPKEKVIMKVIDKLNLKLGEKVKFGNMDLQRKWKMRQEHLTPQYSTNLKHIITVKTG
ncbi:DNA polymerase V subunit UmuC [compost metagenome]